MLRRDFLALSATAACASKFFIAEGWAQAPSFDQLFDATIGAEDLLSAGRNDRERQIFEYENYASKGVAPRHGKSTRQISERAIKLIVSFEVTNQKTYEARYEGAIWPKGRSGITIGIGYDVGYVTKPWLHEDWDQMVDPTQVAALEIACEVSGEKCSSLLPKLNGVSIPWSTAYKQFRERVLPLYVAETLAALPNADKLSDDSLGSLVSLVYNRGASFKNTTDRYAEMRAIRLHMVQGELELIPNELRSMKKIWKGDPSMAGLLVRRELEARLFEEGLK